MGTAAVVAVVGNSKVALVAMKITYLKVGPDQAHSSSSTEEISHARGAYQEMEAMMLTIATLLNTVSTITTLVIILMSAETPHLKDRVIFVVMPVI